MDITIRSGLLTQINSIEDCQTQIVLHEQAAKKSHAKVIATYVAYVALAVFAIYYGAFFSPDNLYLILGLTTLSLKTIFAHSFINPYTFEEKSHKKALKFIQKIETKMTSGTNALQAKLEVLEDKYTRAAEKISNIFKPRPEYKEERAPKNYQAYKISAQTEDKHRDIVMTMKAHRRTKQLRYVQLKTAHYLLSCGKDLSTFGKWHGNRFFIEGTSKVLKAEELWKERANFDAKIATLL